MSATRQKSPSGKFLFPALRSHVRERFLASHHTFASKLITLAIADGGWLAPRWIVFAATTRAYLLNMRIKPLPAGFIIPAQPL